MGPTASLDPRLLKALSHPLRLRILDLIADHGELSPARIARELGHPLATVSHHTRLLRDLGCVELVRTEPRRGALEHFYRARWLPFLADELWEGLPVALRRGLAAQTFRRIFAEGSHGGAAGGFDRAGAHVDRMPLRLDDRGWVEISELLVGVLERARAIQERSDERGRSDGDGGAGGTRSVLAILHFSAGPSGPARG
jgi:DNA-binding transcriptional ArsR family regulator